ncbi:MAG: fasciclin domain-containing protein [Melioribacteraceae bacterium]|nr:fasciclin domain-containing protein [Melioribacteraceae bacterium]
MKNRLISSMLFVFLLAVTVSAQNKDIVTVAVEAGSFKTLTTAITEAGLVETLKGKGPFTVFAPTDEAFAKLPKGTLEGLLKDKEALKNVLLYHVVSGNVSSKDVVKLDKAKTAGGKDVMIKVKDGKVYINKSVVTTADVEASNGVIHIIDTVLIPKEDKKKSY